MGPYTFKEIGQGSFGKVFLLENHLPPIVMKELEGSPNEQELSLLKELIHPNVVKYLDRPFDFDEERRFSIFMEYCEEGTLKRAITDSTLNYSMATVVKWSIELFTALLYLESKQIAHRDVTPGNIFLDRDFILKLGDFGISKKFDKDSETSAWSEIVGTDLYMAPEIKKGTSLNEAQLYKCDVFGAGIVIFELTERRKVCNVHELLSFTQSSDENVTKFQELISRCSYCAFDIDKRNDATTALRECKPFQKLFGNLMREPRRAVEQTVLRHVDGASWKEVDDVDDDFQPPSVTFNHTINTDKLQDQSKRAPEKQKRNRDPHMEIFEKEWLPKLTRKTCFRHLMVDAKYLEYYREGHMGILSKENDWLKFDCNEKGDGFIDVNELREFLGNQLQKDLESDCSDESAKSLIVEKMFEIQRTFESRTEFDKWQWESALDKSSLSLEPGPLYTFGSILILDFAIQDFCLHFGLCLLWHYHTKHLNWFELFDLLENAIKNIEEAGQVFNSQKNFLGYYLKSSEDEYYLADLNNIDNAFLFRKDLGKVQKFPKEVVRPTAAIPIGLEHFRRALHEQKDAIRRYSFAFVNVTTWPDDVIDTFLSILGRSRVYEESGSLTRAHLSPHAWRVEISYTPGFRKPSPAHLADFYQRTRFLQCIFFSNLILTFTECFCENQCSKECFPKEYVYAPLTEMKDQRASSFSSCSHFRQREFLDAHCLFAKALRVLSVWKEIQMYRITHIHLLKEMLQKAKKDDPQYGFYFLLVSQPDGRNGIYVGEKGSDYLFLTNTFQIEFHVAPKSSSSPFPEYVGLVFINFMEFQKIFQAILDFIDVQYEQSKSIEERKEEYEETMMRLFEDFWKEHKIYEKPEEVIGLFTFPKEMDRTFHDIKTLDCIFFKREMSHIKPFCDGEFPFKILLFSWAQYAPRPFHPQNFYSSSDFQQLVTDQLYDELSKNLKNTNNLLKDYVFLLDECPVVEHEILSTLFSLIKKQVKRNQFVICLFLARQEFLIQQLVDILYEEMTALFQRDPSKLASSRKIDENPKLQKVLRDFEELRSASLEEMNELGSEKKFDNHCLDVPNPLEISLRLDIYRNEQNPSESWILLSKIEKTFMKVDFSEKTVHEGHFDGCRFTFNDGRVLRRTVGIGFNYVRIANFDSEHLKGKFGVETISEIPRVFPPYVQNSPLNYVFQLNVQPSEWPWIIYSPVSFMEIVLFDALHKMLTSEELPLESGPLFEIFAQFSWWLLLEKAGSRKIALELPSKTKKNIDFFSLDDNIKGLFLEDVVLLENETIKNLIQSKH